VCASAVDLSSVEGSGGGGEAEPALVGRRVRAARQEERVGKKMGGNFMYWRNMVILSYCATYQTRA
jgi:hypothetical protein